MGAFLRFAEYILSHNLIFGVMIVLRVQSNDHSFTSSLTRKEQWSRPFSPVAYLHDTDSGFKSQSNAIDGFLNLKSRSSWLEQST